MKEFGVFLCMRTCKSLGSLKPFLSYAPQLCDQYPVFFHILSSPGAHPIYLATTVAHPGGGPFSHPSASGEPVLPAPVPAPGPGGCKRPGPHARAHPRRPARCAPRGARSCALALPRSLIAATDAGPRPGHLRVEARKPRGPLGRAKPQLGGFHQRAV